MLKFETKGRPLERGRQQGAVCRELAGKWVSLALADLATAFRVASPAEAVHCTREQVASWTARLQRICPQGIEECRGIAAGARIAESDYFAAVFGWALSPEEPRHCTTLGFRDERGRPLMAKTDDVRRQETGFNTLEITWPESGYRHVHVHFAGTIWTVAGMNERGLAMAMTGIPGVRSAEGIPSLEALHTLLPACATVGEAIELIRDLSIGFYGFSLLLGDREGGLALVEKTGTGTVLLPGEPGGFLLHTNHILDAESARNNPAQSEPMLTNGVRRFGRGRQLAPTLPRTEKGLEAFLADHDAPGAIWQQGEDGLHTDFGAILLPMEGRLRIEQGPPQCRQREEIDLAKVFAKPHSAIG